MWVGNFWGGYNGPASPSNCMGANGAQSPYVNLALEVSGLWFYPGNELGCYYTANSVGTRILTKSPAVNTNCTSNGYSVCNGISGPVASMRMEQWRRGYEDYMYMYLLGHKSGRSASMSVVDGMGGGGLKPWNALNWQNVQPYASISGVWPTPGGGCTDSAAGVPNGPTGAGGPSNCPGEWTNNPDRYAAARLSLAEELGFAPPSTAAPMLFHISPGGGASSGGTSVTISGTNLTGATSVQFGSNIASSFTVNSATEITAISPPGSENVAVTVTTSSGASNALQFEYSSHN